jgi:hypothetical protein
MQRLDTLRLPRLVSVLTSAALAGWGCASSDGAVMGEDTAADATATAAGDGSPGDAADGACSSLSLPLIVTTAETRAGGSAPTALFVPATYESLPSVFQLDTGSANTFLHEPLRDGGTPSRANVTLDAGRVQLGCDLVSVVGIPIIDSAPVNGKPCVGTLGNDRLLTRPVKLDFSAGHVVWNEPGSPFAEAASWPSARFDRPGRYVRIHDVTFDGTPVTLFVDTGSPDSLWVGQQGLPGDVPVSGEDARGDVLKVYWGTVTVGIGSYRETVPVFRAPSFPYLADAARAVDTKVDGMFGLSSFRHGIVLDTDAMLVRLAP